MPARKRSACVLALFLLSVPFLAGCGGSRGTGPEVASQDGVDLGTPGGDNKGRLARESGSLFGEGGLRVGGPDRSRDEAAGIGVNSYLWRATLDTLSFMPVTSADPFGGVVMTDWYVRPGAPDERLKVNAYILDRQLRADGIRVSVFRQVRDQTGGWVDAPVDPGTATALEDTILTRARELRVAAVAQS